MSFCFLLYLWMPPQKNMQRGNWLGNVCAHQIPPQFPRTEVSINAIASVNVSAMENSTYR